MSSYPKYRLGAIAIKYNVGIETLVNILKEKGFKDARFNPSYILDYEQYIIIDKLFAENIEIKQKVIELRKEEMKGKILNLLPSLVDLLNLNKKLKNLSHYNFLWKESEIKILVKNYFDSLPKNILDNIKANNLIKKELFDEIDSFLNEKVPAINLKKRKQANDTDFGDRDDFEEGPYCNACQQAPCMCSDPEQSSSTFWS